MAAVVEGVRIRRIPYPYRAMLAICSDLDETPDRHVYWETMRFLNTTETTAMGAGVGLEIGNSIYFDMPPAQFSYWNTDDAGKQVIRALIQSGHIDCLHSYGDLATTRTHAGQALDELDRYGCRLQVWVDHSVAPTNFGADIMGGHGDERGHEAYHADLTVSHGVRFVWRGRVTSITGQDVRPRLDGMLNESHRLVSARTLAKEVVKGGLARWGSGKYALHGANRVLRSARLRDGQGVYEFIRSNPHWGGVSCCETADGIGQVLTQPMLERLAQRGGICVLYTHLGKISDPASLLNRSARAAFRVLAAMCCEGLIMVTTTHRLLRYLVTRDSLRYRVERKGDTLTISLDRVADSVGCERSPRLDEIDGITFLAGGRWEMRLQLAGGTPIPCRTDRKRQTTYAKVPWRPLCFPAV